MHGLSRQKVRSLGSPIAANFLQEIDAAELRARGAGRNLSESADAVSAAAASGWLQITANANSRPVKLHFAFIEHIADRIHFKVRSVTQGSYSGWQVDSSYSGFLGFYASVGDAVFWKIEPAGTYEGFGDQRPAFFLRDHKGYTVKAVSESGITYLSTGGSGSPLLFTLDDYESY
ncbi:hypothetical protein D3C77_554970 [compost metagenome]